ncbi:SpvB/TcaC N-terminal domain-containing protein [Arthrobacter sp. P2b]|uniref:SpvB/TcaC N-terminal domain-containing protein n=1 Tax=Arthrobacter sp. P2b TaxID=1938741 RepID=UPI0009A7A8D1|nr:SpvB/TcaC N-terminal domain-containing protein [Arthrobacter sp. P2b]SLK00925.1 RHS repeat-associated core domain-containing protein [Arthrobacter sp. P2b]
MFEARGSAQSESDNALDSQPSSNLVPVLNLPKGGGAIQGMGEKFAANPVSGTGSMTVPFPMPPGRAGFAPQLSLSYDSGAGNGPFGFGWSLSLPSVRRKTDRGLPQYDDVAESDVYVLSGAEDLVPVLEADGSRSKDDVSANGFTIHRYRPRIEGLFARIERWTNRATQEIHWRSISRDNVTSVYGRDNNSRIFDPSGPDPAHPTRIFSWLICESYDDRGNAILYEYASENDVGIDRTLANERNRTRTANRYLKRVKYGNRVSRLVQPDLSLANWLFEVVFDYDEGHYQEVPLAQPEDTQHQHVRAAWKTDGIWTVRPDAFSSHRAGFEIRIYRRCRRVLMFHRFPELNQDRVGELGDEPYLVRTVEFSYKDLDYSITPPIEIELGHQGSTRFASFIQSITQSGFTRDDGQAVDDRGEVKYIAYLRRALPPLEFEYSKVKIQDEVLHLSAVAEDVPAGVDGSTYKWVDLEGEGASGILTEQAGTWFYKPNLGEGRFGPLQVVRTKPALSAMATGATQLLDLSGDGQLDVVSFDGPTPGFYERTQDKSWETFRTFRKLPNIRWSDPNVRFIDLDGDGHSDVIITEDNVFTWYSSIGEDGFSLARKVHQPRDEERGPRLVLSDQTQSVYLADLCGDGLTDLVRIRNGEVCYWPNLGYGRFGAKINMDNAPWFDNPDQFEQRRIRLADIDGSGTTDVIYLHRDGVCIYFNQSGNRLSNPRKLPTFPRIDNLSSVSTADLLGNGTACLVWSSPLPADSARPIRYINLMGGQKPHLLVRSTNNLGAETEVDYVASTKFYFEDRDAGKPWITRLPFPVHVVGRVTTLDRISGNRFVSSYTYHHGHFDGVEREFRGFGMVEQRDSEELAAFAAGAPAGTTNVDAASHVPPVLTKTWFHTGKYIARDHVSDFFAGLLNDTDVGEYYREPGLTDDQARERLLPDTVLPDGLTLEEEREACRALKGMMLRQEVYALDATGTSSPEVKKRAATPYTVVEQNFTIQRLQPRLNNRHAVFFAHPREVLSNHLERNPADSRIGHTLMLDVDPFGNVLKSLAVAYGRRNPSTDPALTAEDKAKQSQPLITFTENSYTQNEIAPAVLATGHHRVPIPAEARSYELTGFTPEKGARFSFAEWSRSDFALLASALEIPYEVQANVTKMQRRLIEDVRTLYRKDDMSTLSPLGKVESQALPGEAYTLALTPSLLAQVFMRKQAGQPDEALLADPSALLEKKGNDEGGYVLWDGNWWVPSGKVFFDQAANTSNPAITAANEVGTARAHFFVPRKVEDAFGNTTAIDYDDHDLLVMHTTDPLGNSVAATNDYRVLQPREVTDPNGNRSGSSFDALGMVVATAVMGKQGEPLGDLLEGHTADPTLFELRAFTADPQSRAASLLGKATTRIIYDLDRYKRAAQPPFVATLARETHFEPGRDGQTKMQLTFTFSDGFGREIQRKIQAEPGIARKRQNAVPLPSGDIGPGKLEPGVANAPQRWVGSGRTVFNNKGKPVKQYEPFFSATHLHESEREVTDTGVSPVLFYDPVERVIATLHPNHTYEKVIFDSWTQTIFDVNDTVAAAQGKPAFATRNQTGDPRTDPDIAGYVHEYFKSQPVNWDTWHAQRSGNTLDPGERDAAKKAEAHANTPTTAHLDVLGRVFITLGHNKTVCPGHALDGSEERIATRVELDIEGNQRAVRDAVKRMTDAQGSEMVDELGRIVMRYDYDLLGNRIHQASMEAGERWMLSDALGKPIRAWDSRFVLRRLAYDELRRRTGLFVIENGDERLAERMVYGEGQGDASNHRGRIFQRYDGAGVITYVAYDFKGNLLAQRREFLPDYKVMVNWLQNPAASDGNFTNSTTFDALNRPLTVTSPDDSVYRPAFNEANHLDKIEVELRGAGAATAFVTNVDYDAKGRREKIEYKNGATTKYEYDPLTFRLSRMQTTRSAITDVTASQLFKDPLVVQDLRYSYDPIGNITRIEDLALKSIIRSGQKVEPVNGYTYDAIYRLIEALGREHIGQNGFDFDPPNGNYRDIPFFGHRAHPNDLQAIRNYTERYQYDVVGNFEALAHRFNGAGWTRHYEYEESSMLETGKKNNQLTRTTVGNGLNHVEPYTHDVHGNMTSMPHLAAVFWDFKDELQRADLGGGGTAYYVYDGAGQRLRKVIESQHGARQKERLYLGGFEIYREYNRAGITLERESLHVLDDQQRIALVETQTIHNGNAINGPVPQQRYQLGNHLGSSSVELDEGGALIAYEEYHPHGTTSFQTGRSAAEVSLKRYRYTGKERDDETGLSYHGARYYSASLARWTQPDPALWRLFREEPGTRRNIRVLVNPFTAMAGNPLAFVDLDGEQDTVYTRYLDRQFATVEGARQVHEGNRELGRLAMRVLAIPRVAGTVQAIGGVLELVGAGALLATPEPTMATKAGGAVLGAHGLDTLQAGARTLYTGEVTHTVTHDTAAAVAASAGASPQTANWVGVGADVLMSVGPATVGALGRAGPRIAAEGVAQAGDDLSGALFRGTSEGFAGSPGLQRVGVTPASQDPLVATVFATESESYGRGVVQIATRADLEGVAISEGNYLAALEREVAVEIAPFQFAERAGVQIGAAEARGILERMGHALPAQIRGPAGVTHTLGTTARLTDEEITLFIKEARVIAGGR